MKVSLITTVFNEEKTITPFLKSVLVQIRKPNEIIIVDGGSTDFTVKKISEFKTLYKLNIQVFGNHFLFAAESSAYLARLIEYALKTESNE